jgi:hypothetical protein
MNVFDRSAPSKKLKLASSQLQQSQIFSPIQQSATDPLDLICDEEFTPENSAPSWRYRRMISKSSLHSHPATTSDFSSTSRSKKKSSIDSSPTSSSSEQLQVSSHNRKSIASGLKPSLPKMKSSQPRHPHRRPRKDVWISSDESSDSHQSDENEESNVEEHESLGADDDQYDESEVHADDAACSFMIAASPSTSSAMSPSGRSRATTKYTSKPTRQHYYSQLSSFGSLNDSIANPQYQRLEQHYESMPSKSVDSSIFDDPRASNFCCAICHDGMLHDCRTRCESIQFIAYA